MVAAVGLLLEGALSRDWWTLTKPDEQVSVHMGMTSSKVCIENSCRVLPHAKVAGLLGSMDDRLWLMAGAAAAWGAWVTAVFLFATGFMAWRRRPKPGVLLAQVTAVLCGLLLIWAALYIFLFPSGINAQVAVGHSRVTYFLGALCGLTGSVLLAIGGEQAATPSLDEVFD